MDVETRKMLQAIITGITELEQRIDTKVEQQKDDILEVMQQQTDTIYRNDAFPDQRR